MTAPNHVAGGIVITGIFASLFNFNIFQSPYTIILTIVGSLLPDIDHTKSIIGKMVYPLAKFISVKYGHRTITHSLLFLLIITLLGYLLEFYKLAPDGTTLILFFSVFSHFILDMVTVQGIPLFYPFYRNPCVLPANVELRIRTGNLKQEGIALFIFCFFTIFLQNLFAEGFWYTYNKKFNDIKHVYRQFQKENKLYNVKYDFNLFQRRYKGVGALVYADWEQIYLLSDTLIHLKENSQGLYIKNLELQSTNKKLKLEKLTLSNISLDSINRILKKRFVSKGVLFSNTSIDLLTNKGVDKNTYFNLENIYNAHFIKNITDSINHVLKSDIEKIKLQLDIEEKANQIQNANYFRSKNRITFLEKKLKTEMNNYDRNEILNEIIRLKQQTRGKYIVPSKSYLKLKTKLKFLQEKDTLSSVFFSGNLSLFDITEKK